MAINKVIYKGNTLIDLTSDTVTPENLISGVTAHAKNGEVITGTMVHGIDTSDATATAEDILEGKTAYVKDSKITGTIPFQPAITITPGTIDQIAVPSGYYTGGAITIKGDANLVASNIVSGKSIFGVSGTASSGGGNTEVEDGLIIGELTSITNDRVTSIGNYAFYSCTNLTITSYTVNSVARLYCWSILPFFVGMATRI